MFNNPYMLYEKLQKNVPLDIFLPQEIYLELDRLEIMMWKLLQIVRNNVKTIRIVVLLNFLPLTKNVTSIAIVPQHKELLRIIIFALKVDFRVIFSSNMRIYFPNHLTFFSCKSCECKQSSKLVCQTVRTLVRMVEFWLGINNNRNKWSD